ncbi:MAG: alkaline phosphatase family protein [Clostridiaceae bacterium]|nr:alkaline phosphatase family protein [Clostridiaceae bacterium]
MGRKLLLISLDAVGDHDLELLLEQPAFQLLREKGTMVREVDSVFVTNTYPIHACIQTGVSPYRHGIIENDIQDPGKKIWPWRYHVRHLTAPTLPDRATQSGKTVCSIMFPVTGGANIRYNFPEIPGKISLPKRIALTLQNGRPSFILSCMLRFMKHMLSSGGHADDMIVSIAERMIQTKQFDLMMLHLLDVDSTKHKYGPYSDEAKNALLRTAARVDRILQAVSSRSDADQYDIVVFSDHSCLPVHTALHPNTMLQAADIAPSEAFFHSAHGCCFLRIYTPEPSDKLLDFLSVFSSTPGVKRALTADEMHSSGAGSQFYCGFAAEAGYVFGHFAKGQHGYTLDNDKYKTFYFAKGASIAPGRKLEGGTLLDICPLCCDILELEPWTMEGCNRIF